MTFDYLSTLWGVCLAKTRSTCEMNDIRGGRVSHGRHSTFSRRLKTACEGN